MKRFWVVRHAQADLFLASFAKSSERWVHEESEALRFEDPASAEVTIRAVLDGHGVALQVIAPA